MIFRKILLIDDNDIDNTINRFLVTKLEISETIIIFNSALKALEYLNNSKGSFPELVFLDINMPAMDGFGFLEKFLQMNNKEINKSIVIMLTSSQDANDIERATSIPCVKSYIIKPLSKVKIFELLYTLQSSNDLN